MSRALPTCSFTDQAAEGSWDFAAQTYRPSTCLPKLLTPEQASSCLRGRTLTFAGDSNIRDFAVAVLSFLLGKRAEDAGTGLITNRPNWTGWENARVHPERHALQHLLGKMDAHGKHRQMATGFGEFRHPVANWTIRLNAKLVYASQWPQLNDFARGFATDDIHFVAFGIHGTVLLESRQALNWTSAPEYWLQDDFIRPYIERYCATSAAHGERAAPRSPADAGAKASAPVVPDEHPVVPLISAANRATVGAAHRMGFPLLDFSRMLRTTVDGQRDMSEKRGSQGAAASEVAWSEACMASPDGVHVSEWVDHVRAEMMLSYLCADGGFLRAPLTSRPFSRRAAGCRNTRQGQPPD